jgi:hypothetical protein
LLPNVVTEAAALRSSGNEASVQRRGAVSGNTKRSRRGNPELLVEYRIRGVGKVKNLERGDRLERVKSISSLVTL